MQIQKYCKLLCLICYNEHQWSIFYLVVSFKCVVLLLPFWWERDTRGFLTEKNGAMQVAFWSHFHCRSSHVSLQWRHNGRYGVSNHQPHDCFLNRLFRHRSKKTSKLRVTGLCAGIHRRPGNSPAKWPVTRKMFPFDDVIMYSHCPRDVYVFAFCNQILDVIESDFHAPLEN